MLTVFPILYFPCACQRAQIKYLLERHGYVLVEERQWDDFYAHPALI